MCPEPGSLAPRPSAARFAEQVATLDADRFVGRADILGPVEAHFAPGGRGRVVHLHGPGGIGKSALLREIGRRARAQGRAVRSVDGRLVPASTEALLAALAGADRDVQPVILIDSFEQIGSLAPVLRDQVLPALPADAVIVTASRQRPSGIWFRDGWEHIVHSIQVGPLTDAESDELLARHHITGAQAAQTRVWAKGLPLALHVAGANAGGRIDAEDLNQMITTRLVGDDLEGVDGAALAVAAVARAVDERLLVAALPERAGDASAAAYEQLRPLAVIEPYGNRLALHDVVRAALRDDLRRREPATYRRLVGRIADHLHQRVLAGEYALLPELTSLIEDPVVRWGFSPDGGAAYRVSHPAPGDAEEAASMLDATGTRWWAGVERFFLEAPEVVTVVRSAAGSLAGFSIAVSPAKAPAWVDDDVVLGPVLAHALERVPSGEVVIWRDAFDVIGGRSGDPSSRVVGLLNYPPHLRAEVLNARSFYGVVDEANTVSQVLAGAIGALRLPQLETQDGERTVNTYLLEHRPGRLADTVRERIYLEQHLVPGPPLRPATEAAVRDALREFHDPVALAANPLAEGSDVARRAEFVRARLTAALPTAFGRSASEQRLRRLIERSYLDPTGGHRRAMSEAHLSRSTYYRRLGEATARLQAAVAHSA